MRYALIAVDALALFCSLLHLPNIAIYFVAHQLPTLFIIDVPALFCSFPHLPNKARIYHAAHQSPALVVIDALFRSLP